MIPAVPHLASGPISGLGNMLGLPFVQHALLGGTAVALLSGLVGHFVVLRGQVFAADTLSHVAYAGALAALAAGVGLRFGLFAACVAVGLLLGVLGGHGVVDDVVTGVTFSWILGLGVFFLADYTTHAATGDSGANVNVLFGSAFGIGAAGARTAVWIAVGAIAALVGLARPLLFSSLDPEVARARGVPVRLLGTIFLVIVGITAAEASLSVGALLLLGLIAAPPAAARLVTDRPWLGFVLSGIFAVVATWVGIVIAYAAPALPVSFDVVSVACVIYLLAAVTRTPAINRRRRARAAQPTSGEPCRP